MPKKKSVAKKKTSKKKVSRKKTTNKKAPKNIEKPSASEIKLIENFVALQKVMTNLSIKFDNLANQISKLLNLFDISAKALAKKEIHLGQNKKEMEEIKNKLNEIAGQNKIIAKGLALLHEKDIYDENNESFEKKEDSFLEKKQILPELNVSKNITPSSELSNIQKDNSTNQNLAFQPNSNSEVNLSESNIQKINSPEQQTTNIPRSSFSDSVESQIQTNKEISSSIPEPPSPPKQDALDSIIQSDINQDNANNNLGLNNSQDNINANQQNSLNPFKKFPKL